MSMEGLLETGSIADIGAAYRTRKISVAEAAQWYLARIAKLNPDLNAVREVSTGALDDARAMDAELATGRDRGPLHGIPVLLKDNIFTSGMACTAGAKALLGFKPTSDATLVRKLRAAGAVILGKTNLTEFADFVADVMPSEFSGAGGVVKNPHGIRYDRGQGSSVGSAASVAASLCVFAIGSETQNSIQTPACYSGVVGYKPSVGLVSRAGVVPLVPSQDSPGPLARSVADAALVVSVLAGADVRDTQSLFAQVPLSPAPLADIKGMRIGVPRKQQAERADFASVLPLFEAALKKLAAAGAVIVDPCDLPSAEQLQDVRSSVFRTEFKAALNALLEDNGSPCGIGSMADLISWNEKNPDAIPYGQSLLIAANATAGLDDPAYRADRARDIALSRAAGIDAAVAMHGVDALIAPMGAAAKTTGKAGAPVVAIPAGMDGKTPFGVTLYSPFGSDARLLAVAAAVEHAVGHRP
jgi:amidase